VLAPEGQILLLAATGRTWRW